MEGLLNAILRQLGINRQAYDNADDIVNATNYSNDSGFYLFVGVTGAVVFTTITGKTMTKTLPVGRLDVKLKSITGSGTTATSLIAMY